MSKYEPLARYLNGLERDSWDAKFPDIERVLGFDLPKSAYTYPAWWSNQDGHHSQTRGWRDAGWETCNVNLPDKRIRFVRIGKRKPALAKTGTIENQSRPSDREIEKLIASARELTGIEDRETIMATALRHLIQAEAAKGLAALGGSDHQAKAPERRRFW
ncbi:MAG: hypothetical protein NBV60_03795 [Erythrobacter sp.]|nr:hypothetical protein [Erythrobacter sp.]